ncbi:MAG: immune inhibitor A [Dehalococcoidia bacterium]|nr:immune inhibitor A [Dehalococcoidia bacterium]
MRRTRIRPVMWAAASAVALITAALAMAGCGNTGSTEPALPEPTVASDIQTVRAEATPVPEPQVPPTVSSAKVTPKAVESSVTQSLTTPSNPVIPVKVAPVLPDRVVLNEVDLPDRDLAELAVRLRGAKSSVSEAGSTPPMSVGDQRDFTITNLEDGSPRLITATLQVVSDNAYWFVEDGVTLARDDLAQAASVYEHQVRPAVVGTLGDIASPGLDGDPRLFIIHAVLDGAAGYFGSKDSFPSEVHPHSNESEIIYLDSRAAQHGVDTHLAIIAHELQHAAHFDKDVGEESWVNEGLSEVATQLAGYSVQSPRAFMRRPDTQLNYWPDSPRSTYPHYGAAALFFTYVGQRVGGVENLVELVNEPLDGIAGVRSFLSEHDLTWHQVFADWVVANYLDAEDERYGYLDRRVGIGPVRRLAAGDGRPDSLPQYSARYFRVDTDAESGTITFHGDTEVRQVGTDCPQGPTCWWSGRGDGIDTKLTREFDLTGLDRATLEYQVWHEIEEGWDYGYVQVSDDGGETWYILEGAHTTNDNPSGNGYGSGYTGESREWKRESIDLTEFTGGPVLVRFEYVTDDAVYLDGMLIDGVSIAELGSASADSEWQAEGFSMAGHKLAQDFIVQVVTSTPDGEYTVSQMPLDASNSGWMSLTTPGDGGEIVIVVSPVTAGTRHEAGYVLDFEENQG